jgi:hypothetical protein
MYGKFNDLLFPCNRKDIIHNLFDNLDSGVLVFVDSVSKPI